MKYIAPTITKQLNALRVVLGVKGNDFSLDNGMPIQRTTSAGYESDE